MLPAVDDNRSTRRRHEAGRTVAVRVAAAVALVLSAALPGAARADGPADLAPRAAALVRKLQATGAAAGVSAVDLKTGRTLLAIDETTPMMPASNQKVLTSAFALQRLGSDFAFSTGVWLLDGNVVVAGEFDPTLGDPILAAEARRGIYDELDRWAAAAREVATAGVRDVLVCRQSAGPMRPSTWPANQLDRWYAAPVAELNFHNNCFDVTFRKASDGAEPVVQPAAGRFLRVIDNTRPGPKQLWTLRTADDDATVTLAGTVAAATDEPLSVAVDRPDLLLGRVLADRLVRAGVAVGGEVRSVRHRDVPWGRAICVARTATPLFAVIRRACKRSLNMAAEAMFLRAGDGTWPGSAKLMERTLLSAFDLPAGSLTVVDGSGLSRGNRVTAAAMTKLLGGLARRDDGVMLLWSLPVGGVDGTLSRRFTDPAVRGRVVAKTGYIGGVSTLSGYVLDGDCRVRLAFSVLVNDLRRGTAPAKGLQEDICELLLGYLAAQTQAAGT